MMKGATIEFQFASTTEEKWFLREYLADAWEHFETSDFFEIGWFWRFSQFTESDAIDETEAEMDGLVHLVFDGEPDALVETERERWDRCSGLEEWNVHLYSEPDGWVWHPKETYETVLEAEKARVGEVGGEWQYRLLGLAARYSLTYISEFEEPLPVVGETSERNLTGIGFWTAQHYMMLQCGYEWYDETNAALEDLRFRVKTLVSDFDAETAWEEYERLKAEWDAYEDELAEWIDSHPDGNAPEL